MTFDIHLKASWPIAWLSLKWPLFLLDKLSDSLASSSAIQCSHHGHEDPFLTAPDFHTVLALTRFLGDLCATYSKSTALELIAPDFIPFVSIVPAGFASKPWLCLGLCLAGAGRYFVDESRSIPYGFTFLWGILNH